MSFYVQSQDMATILGVSKTTLYSMLEKGDAICSIKSENDRHRFSIDDIRHNIKNANKRSTKVLCFANIKGGIGKTFLSIHIAMTLREFGFKVLVVDTDKQGNISKFFLGEIPGKDQSSILNIFLEAEPIGVIRGSSFKGIDIIPANPKFNEINRFFDSENPIKLDSYLQSAKKGYDYIIIDNPADVSTLPVEAALIASDAIISIIIPEEWSVDGLDYLTSGIKSIKKVYKKDIDIIGCALNKIRKQRSLDKQLFDGLKATNGYIKGIKVFKNYIQETTQYSKILHDKISIFDTDIEDRYKNSFYNLTLEVLNELPK